MQETVQLQVVLIPAEFSVMHSINRLPPMTKIILLLACCAIGSPTASSTQSTFWEEIHRQIVVIHRLDWSSLSTDDIQKMIPVVLKRTEADIPKDSQYRFGSCDGSTYMQTGSGGNRISFEFVKVLDSERRCRTRLRALQVDVTLDSREAEVFRLRIIEALSAAGSLGADSSEYQWRSDDSLTKNVLTTAILADVASSQRKILSIKLRHILVSPETVDELPFHKGYFPPVCGAANN